VGLASSSLDVVPTRGHLWYAPPVFDFLEALVAVPAVGRRARGAADWVDLQLEHVVQSLARLAPRTRGRLLDVGCGDKPYEQIFRPYVDEYLGIEHRPTFHVTSAASRDKADIHYEGKTLPFPDASFDTVLSVQVLEHTPEPENLLAEMARVLKPDGLLILTAPFSFRLHEEPHDYFRFSRHGLEELCARSGLVIEELSPHGNLWSLLGHKLNSYLALHVIRIAGVAQRMGKLGHEVGAPNEARTWALPAVAPAMVAIAAAARVLDRVAPDPTETLGYTLLARHALERPTPSVAPLRDPRT
jgi:SAM-dependent methyltransferase